MLSNAYFLVKIHFDTAENEPAKKIAKVCKKSYRKTHKNAYLLANIGFDTAENEPAKKNGKS